MSKTYNERHQFNKSKPVYEFPNGFDTQYQGIIEPGEIRNHDYSYTTNNGIVGWDPEVTRMNCRHPNKKRKRKLLKEFKLTNTDYLGPTLFGFDNRFGDINIRRRRKSIKRIENEKRRFQLKKQAKELIEDGINELNN